MSERAAASRHPPGICLPAGSWPAPTNRGRSSSGCSRLIVFWRPARLIVMRNRGAAGRDLL